MDTVRQHFTGYEKDEESGLEYAQARYYSNQHGRFTSVDPLMASAKTGRPESFNRYAYCYNNPLKFVDPDGMEVQFLDKKARERILSTLPENLRKKVEAQINKDGFLKKGSLDKIKSTNANFLDLKAGVNAKGTIEVMTAANDPRGPAFFYKSEAEEKKETYDGMIKAGASPEEAKEAADDVKVTEANRSMGLGVTFSPKDKESPNGNWRVVLSDGTGEAADAPQSDLAAVSAHETYVHAVRGIQGKTWQHEYNQPPKRPGPVDTQTKIVEQRTRAMYKKP